MSPPHRRVPHRLNFRPSRGSMAPPAARGGPGGHRGQPAGRRTTGAPILGYGSSGVALGPAAVTPPLAPGLGVRAWHCSPSSAGPPMSGAPRSSKAWPRERPGATPRSACSRSPIGRNDIARSVAAIDIPVSFAAPAWLPRRQSRRAPTATLYSARAFSTDTKPSRTSRATSAGSRSSDRPCRRRRAVSGSAARHRGSPGSPWSAASCPTSAPPHPGAVQPALPALRRIGDAVESGIHREFQSPLVPISMICPVPPRVRPAPPLSARSSFAPEDDGCDVLGGFDRHGAHARGEGGRVQTVQRRTRAGAAGVEGDDLEIRHNWPVAARLAGHRGAAAQRRIPQAEAPSAATRVGTVWCRQPIIRSGSRWPMTWRTETG